MQGCPQSRKFCACRSANHPLNGSGRLPVLSCINNGTTTRQTEKWEITRLAIQLKMGYGRQYEGFDNKNDFVSQALFNFLLKKL